MRKHLHPILNRMVAVTRNGSSSSFLSVIKSTGQPMLLTTDKNMHPAWTGKREGVSMEDERMQKLLSKYETWGATLMSNQANEKQG